MRFFSISAPMRSIRAVDCCFSSRFLVILYRARSDERAERMTKIRITASIFLGFF